ncbi:asparagine synthase C-terminal domain-containing protein [Polaribacter litorisediminis]|uniref:asparagine synthase C-terminal domain-containing protein n=1 Tax=Polaribacter litorisediminis TaxID=1908341 RepID=UPI001CBF679A|nr:asparagine synthase C-terminal domain-containing protein [Polaribacter litorisediminis]UAM98469.1 asparagine synthase C-terminal domain-containing protein [Polaribacter litorisediminis]
MNISLQHNKGFHWFKSDALFFKGYFYIDDHFYEKENALNHLSTIKKSKDFKKLLSSINGVFTIIISLEDKFYIASDITRSFPIFYTFQNKKLHVSDAIIDLKNKFKINDFDSLSEIEFKSSHHTHGKKTLLKNVFQVQAGSYLIVKNNTVIENEFFFSYAIQKESSDSYSLLKNKVVIAFENSFKRLINSLENRTAVVPLSGGYDSRLIAVMLKKHNYKNVVCYTYGHKNSFEIENSKKTAQALGFKWFFIEYTPLLIEGYLKTDEFKKYAHFAGKLSSMPYLQEYFAVKYLSEANLISKDAIFIPGFAGDLLGGSQFLKVIPENLKTDEIVNLIVATKFSHHTLSTVQKKRIAKEVLINLKKLDANYSNKIASSVFENYDLTEKIAKYIFNSANFYTFFGYEHRFPFWDTALLTFFKAVPVKYKIMKTLFDEVLIDEYFKPYQVSFGKEIQATEKGIQSQKIKDSIKSFLPTFIKQRILEKSDWNNYKAITQQMLDELRLKKLPFQRKSKDYNEIIAQWYVYFSKNKL